MKPLFATMCLALTVIASSSHAQTASIEPNGPVSTATQSTTLAPPVTLAQAMAALPSDVLGQGRVMMAPYGAMVPPLRPADASTLPADTIVDPLDRIAVDYNRSMQTFGHVTAIAPKTMTILNTSPDLGDIPFAEVAGQHPLPFLLGTLTPDQMHILATSGLGFADLSEDQQALLKAALPNPFLIVPRNAVTPTMSMADLQKPGPRQQAAFKRMREMSAAYKSMEQTIPADEVLRSVKLHAFLTANLTPNAHDGGVTFSFRNGMPSPGPFKLTYQEFDGLAHTEVQDQLQGLLSTKEPNALKDGQLDWKLPALQTKVGLADVKTVGDLVTAIAKATGLEVYVDGNYSHLPLDFAGAVEQPQAAVDLLQGLSVCVCGAWRQVGPCWILTDDVAGYGTRYANLAEAVQKWSNRLTDADKVIGQRLVDLDWARQLHFMDKDPVALPQHLVDQLTKNGKTDGSIPWKDVPQVTIDAIDSQLKGLADQPQMSSYTEQATQDRENAQPDTPIGYTLEIGFAYELPETGLMPFDQTPYRPQKPTAVSNEDAQPPVNLGKIDMQDPVRALLCTAETTKEATALVDKAADVGFNALYLDVFHNGRTYFPNRSIKPESVEASGVLQAAIDEAAGKGIAVYATVDLFCWRKDGGAAHPAKWPAFVAQDLTIAGDPADVDMRRRIDNGLIRNDLELADMRVIEGNHSWVSPFDPNVEPALTGMVSALASTRGIAGIVVEDATPPGYVGVEDRIDPAAALGYTSTARLDYLRKYHADPVDISPEYNLQLWLPYQGFQTTFNVDMSTFGTSSSNDWLKFRAAAADAVAVDCQRAIRAVNPSIPLLVREGQYGETFDPWPNAANPNVYIELDGKNKWEYVTSASVVDLPVAADVRAKPWKIVEDANWRRRHFGHGQAGGVVLDLVNGNTDEPALRTLDQLSPYFAKAQK